MIFRRSEQRLRLLPRKILLAAPSVMNPSRNSTVSIAPASIAIWRSSTLGNSEIALMSQRSHRLSSAVIAATPVVKQLPGRRKQGVAHDETVGITPFGKAWSRRATPRVTCR